MCGNDKIFNFMLLCTEIVSTVYIVLQRFITAKVFRNTRVEYQFNDCNANHKLCRAENALLPHSLSHWKVDYYYLLVLQNFMTILKIVSVTSRLPRNATTPCHT